MTILVCGEALYDLFQIAEPEPGRLSLDARVGGSPFNVAVGIARLGGAAALLTGISRDLLGQRLMARLEDEGVGTGYLVRSGRRTTLSLVGLDAQGSPDYAFYGVGSADVALETTDMPNLTPTVQAMHFGSYSIAMEPAADAFASLAEQTRDRFISLDPNVRPTIEPDMAVWRSRIDALRRRCNLIKVSAEDLGMLYSDTDPAEIAQNWLEDGVELVIVTDGGKSVRAWRKDTVQSLAPDPIDVVDTVGAGDSFQAAVLAGLQARGRMAVDPDALPVPDLKRLLARASRAAAITCTRRGAELPTITDLETVG
ncbi:MAG: carbohydrate kinase [Paracoccaceae bacterium]